MRDGPLRQLRRYRRKEELNLPWGSTLLARPLQPTFGPHRNAPRPSAEARDEKPIVTHCSGMGSAPRRMDACSMAFADARIRAAADGSQPRGPSLRTQADHPWSRMKPIRGFLVQVSKCRTVIEATAHTKRVPIRARPRILDFRRAPKAWCEQLPQRTGLQSAPGIEASITPDDIIAQRTAPAGRTRPRPAPTETSRKAGSSGAPAAPLRIGS